MHCESKKLDPSSFEHNFGKYCPIFSQPSIYIDGWLYGMRMTSVVCNVPVLSQNDSTLSSFCLRYLDAKFHHPSPKIKKFPKIPTDGCMAIPALAGLLVIIRSLLQKEINYD